MFLRKRKAHQIPLVRFNCNIPKFKKHKGNIDKSWVSASSISNYMINDPIIDYFKIIDKSAVSFKSAVSPRSVFNFSQILKTQGIEFENAVIRLLKKKMTNIYRNFIQIGFGKSDVLDYGKYLETIDAMSKGIPVIYQAILHDEKNKIYGSADLLVRNDYIHIICGDIKEYIPEPPIYNCSNRNGRYYYIVIDIKSSTLNLRANGNTMINSGRTYASKGQIYLYHKMVSDIQMFDSNIAFILGRKYKYTSKNMTYSGRGWFDRLGSINFSDIDKFVIDKVDDAVKWRREVQSNHHDMYLYPKPSNDNLYPNMNNKLDDEFRSRKRKLAEFIGEHTLIGWVGVEHRKTARSNGVDRYDDFDCNVDILGVTGNKRRKIVSTFLMMNRKDSFNFTPQKITSGLYNWRDDKCSEAYVDFETVPSVLLEKYSDKTNPLTELGGQWVFLIGVWYKSQENWTHRTFVADKLSCKGEAKIIKEFTDFVAEHKFTKLYHWSKSAEPCMYRGAYKRMFVTQNIQSTTQNIPPAIQYDLWKDMCFLFKEANIGIKGCKTYGLKDIAKSMYNLDYIPEVWDSSIDIKTNCETVSSGIDAIVTTWQINNDITDTVNSLKGDQRMDDIIKYNRIDCKIMHDIMKYIRSSH